MISTLDLSFQPQQTWEKPGDIKENIPEYFVSAHPGAGDTDSEDEGDQTEENQGGNKEKLTSIVQSYGSGKKKKKETPVEIIDEPIDEQPMVTE